VISMFFFLLKNWKHKWIIIATFPLLLPTKTISNEWWCFFCLLLTILADCYFFYLINIYQLVTFHFLHNMASSCSWLVLKKIMLCLLYTVFVLWKFLSIQMIFWWICGGKSGLPVLFLCHLEAFDYILSRQRRRSSKKS